MSRPARWATPHTLALIAVALAVLVTFADALSPERALYERDIHSYFLAQRAALRAVVAQGSAPLWNPWVGFGTPFLADASAELAYPPTWLLLPLPLPLQFDIFAVAHALVAGFGAAALARRVFASALASYVAGTSYALAGPVLSAVGLYHHFAGAALLPWVLWALEGVLSRPDRRRTLALGTLVALEIVAGSLDLVLMTGLLASGRLVLLLRRGRAAERPAVLSAVALAGALGLALGAVQWLPTVERGLSGLRAAQDARTRTFWSLHPRSLVDLAVPRLVSDGPLSPAERGRLFEGREPLLACLYLGVPTLVLAGLALVSTPSRAAPLALGFGLLVLASLGRHTPAYGLLLGVPGFSLLRYPQKYLLPASLCLALLAGAGAWALTRDRTAIGAKRTRAFALATIVGAVLLAIVSTRGTDSIAALKLGRSALVAAVTAVLLWQRSRATGASRLVTLALALLCGLDLVLVGRGTNPTAPVALYEHRPPVLDLLGPRSGRVFAASDPGCLAPGEGPAGFSASAVAALGFLDTLRPPSGARFQIFGSYDGEFTGIGPRWSVPFTELAQARLGTPQMLRLLQIGSVGRVLFVGKRPLDQLEPLATLEDPYVCPLQVLRVPEALPPAYVVDRERPEGASGGLAAVLAPGFDPRSEVLLAGGTRRDGAQRPDEGPERGRARARILSRAPDALELEAELASAGVLVVTEAYDEGWRAQVDGRDVPVLRANGLFRAVRLSAGRHDVVFRYAPWAARVGAVVSALGAVSTALALPWRRGSGLSRA